MAFRSPPPQVAGFRQVSSKRATVTILFASIAVLGILLAIIYGHGRPVGAPAWISGLPALNALLNATSALFLVRAYRLRKKDAASHARNMLRALGASGLFLVSYVVYHSFHGDTKFPGHGPIRPIYFFFLISHVTLSAVALPLIFSSFFFGLSGRFRQHRAISRYTFPVWLYVSTTGVVVFVLLKTYS
jgi:putative membrane protein